MIVYSKIGKIPSGSSMERARMPIELCQFWRKLAVIPHIVLYAQSLFFYLRHSRKAKNIFNEAGKLIEENVLRCIEIKFSQIIGKISKTSGKKLLRHWSMVVSLLNEIKQGENDV